MYDKKIYITLTNILSTLTVIYCATTPPTSQPTTPTTTGHPPGSCEWQGQWHPHGTHLEQDPYNCSMTVCDYGSIVHYDHECMFRTPVCYGTSERVLGQCCPVCHNNQTTTPRTTTPITTTPLYGCNVDGVHYGEGETISEDKVYGCYGTICQDGGVKAWDHKCAFYTPTCDGRSEKVPGQCCPVCYNETTTPTTRTTTPDTRPHGCLVDGVYYNEGQRINKDPCVICRCLNGIESCLTLQCDDALDCATRYRPYGACCFICVSGSSMLMMNNPLVIVLMTLCFIVRKWY